MADNSGEKTNLKSSGPLKGEKRPYEAPRVTRLEPFKATKAGKPGDKETGLGHGPPSQ